MSTPTDFSLPENEDIFKILIEESPTPMALYVGREMVVQLANTSMLKTWGKHASVIGKTYHEALPELEGQPIFKILDDVYTSGIAYEATEDKVNLFVDGILQTYYFNFTFKPLKNANGVVWAVINTAADVTELVTTRQKLAASEERIQFTLDSAELGTWDIDRIADLITWNDRCRDLYGFSPGEAVNITNVRQYVHPDDSARITVSVIKAIDPKSDGNYDDSFRIVHKDGRTSWIKCKGRAYFNEDGQCIRFAGTALDITADVQSREQQQILAALVENSADAIGVATLDSKVTYGNKALYELLGIEDTKEGNISGIDYYMPKDAERLKNEAIPLVMATGSWNGEINYRHFKTGEPVPVHLNVFRIDDPASGKPMARASVARDLRPEREAKNEQYKLLSLIDHSSDFVSLSDLDGNVTYVNAAGRTMLGIRHSQIEQHNTAYVMPEEMERVKTVVADGLNKDGRWSGQLNYRHFETGEPIPVFGTTMLVYDSSNGKPQGRATIARDLRREIADKKALVES